MSFSHKREKNPRWLGGISFEPYGIEFSLELKETIRERDVICIICSKTKEENKRLLHIHHIDYDKQNNISNNLITLCISCHPKTNQNRKHWKQYFQNKMLLQ